MKACSWSLNKYGIRAAIPAEKIIHTIDVSVGLKTRFHILSTPNAARKPAPSLPPPPPPRPPVGGAALKPHTGELYSKLCVQLPLISCCEFKTLVVVPGMHPSVQKGRVCEGKE